MISGIGGGVIDTQQTKVRSLFDTQQMEARLIAEELSETRLIADTQQINGDGIDTQQTEARSMSNTQQILRAEQALVGST